MSRRHWKERRSTLADGGVYERIAVKEAGFVFHGRDLVASLQLADMVLWSLAYHRDRVAEAKFRTVSSEFDEEVEKRIRLAMQRAANLGEDLREIAANLDLDVGVLGPSAIARRIKKFPVELKRSNGKDSI